MIRFIFIFYFVNICLSLKATNLLDSLNFLSAKDTIFIEVTPTQEKTFQHIVKEKQTLYSLAKFYGLTVETIYYYNPPLKNKVLSIDDRITIPLPNRSILRYKTMKFDPREYIPVCYKVKPGDNLFRISKVHFKMPIDSVILRNNLSSHVLSVGQILQLGWVSIKGIPAKYQMTKAHIERLKNEKTQQRFEFLRVKSGKKSYQEHGVAVWQKDAHGQTPLYALHRRAALNSFIAVENPMQKKIVLVKVIGRLPERAYGREIMIVLSKAAAQQLGAKDKRFFVKLKYMR